MRYVLILLALVALVGLSVWFANENAAPGHPIDLLVTEVGPVPTWMSHLMAAASGATLGVLVLSLPLVRLKFRVRRQARAIGELEQEIHGLRTLPIDEEIGDKVQD